MKLLGPSFVGSGDIDLETMAQPSMVGFQDGNSSVSHLKTSKDGLFLDQPMVATHRATGFLVAGNRPETFGSDQGSAATLGRHCGTAVGALSRLIHNHPTYTKMLGIQCLRYLNRSPDRKLRAGHAWWTLMDASELDHLMKVTIIYHISHSVGY